MLRHALELEKIARDFIGLPADLNFNCPAFIMPEEWRLDLIAHAGAIRTIYDHPGWVQQQLALWPQIARNSQAA
jgi:hypothetical protein